ncbi:MAG: type II toxin-antitoxin system Phd/YefM family antitoxin [Kiloniellaceae bacterium]
MTTIGAFEAKTHFARLLERAARGEHIVITKHGVPVARLVPFAGPDREKARAAIARLKALRKGQTLGGISWKELRDEGRR